MKESVEQKTLVLLTQLTHELRILNLWNEERPKPSDLVSSAPFCCDTLAFEQWLQFVFIERIKDLIAKKESLPSEISISPMAEEAFTPIEGNAIALINTIKQIDTLLNGHRKL